jgi:beta-N-acetylglucosaminidase
VSENTLLAQTTQRLQLTIYELEQKAHLASPTSPTTGSTTSNTNYEHHISQLTDEVRQLESALRNEKFAHSQQLRDIQLQLNTANESIQRLQLEVKSRWSKEDVEKLKKQLRILKKIVKDGDYDDKDNMNSINNRGKESDQVITCVYRRLNSISLTYVINRCRIAILNLSAL